MHRESVSSRVDHAARHLSQLDGAFDPGQLPSTIQAGFQSIKPPESLQARVRSKNKHSADRTSQPTAGVDLAIEVDGQRADFAGTSGQDRGGRMADSKFRAFMIASCVIVALMHTGVAQADSILVPGADTVHVDFETALEHVGGDIPLAVGTPVLGSLLYGAWSPFAFPLLDFSMSVAGDDFTTRDVLDARVVEFADTLGFDAQLVLKGRPGLGDFAERFRFEIFREFGDSNLGLGGENSFASGHVILAFDDPSPVPEPSSLVLLVTGLSLCGATTLARRLGFFPVKS
jgi:hypothetical protein